MDSQQRPRRRTTRGGATPRPRADGDGVNSIISGSDQDEIVFRHRVPVLPIRNAVILPSTVTPLYIDHEKTRRAVESAFAGEGIIFAVTQRAEAIENPGPHDLYQYGVEAAIEKAITMPDGVLSVVLRSVRRARVLQYYDAAPYLCADIEGLPEITEESPDAIAHVRVTHEHFEMALKNTSRVGDDAMMNILNLIDPGALADAIAMSIDMPLHARQAVLETIAPLDRLELVDKLLIKELEILEIESNIHQSVQQELDRSQREYYLREQIKVIQRELSDHDPALRESSDLRERISAANMPEEVLARALRDLERLEVMPTMAPEFTVLRTYLDWLITLPWQQRTTDRLDLTVAAEILDAHHYGLSKIKDRLLEFIAVRKLAPQSRSPILCLVGAPGVGKTSLGRSVAEALGRKFVRVSLGGVRDEAEIRGHRRTYVGALPGRIIQTMRQAGTINPLFVLDEIDKLAADYRGDPAAALLEVLDPEQNNAFSDHYLEVPYDLSQVIFILTANSLQPIPAALLDRMEVIELPGYTEEEKAHIAKNFLIPRQMKDHGLTATKIDVRDDALHRVIREYTHEAGVRNLERELGAIMRKVARRVAEGKRGKANVTAPRVADYLGPSRNFAHEAEEHDTVGIAMGVAWTAGGGDLTPIEVAVIEGRGQILLTGSLGDVLRESAQAAISFARSRARELALPAGFYEKNDLHIHLPMGGVHKDGPSAGTPIAIAIISALTGRAVHHDVAMTGEITLRGRVMPVGGVKEKLLAAHRAGIKRFILPRKNVADLEEVTAEIKAALEIIPVDTLDQVIALVLQPAQATAQPAPVVAAVTTDTVSHHDVPQHPLPLLIPDVADERIDEVARPAEKPGISTPSLPREPQPNARRPVVGVS